MVVTLWPSGSLVLGLILIPLISPPLNPNFPLSVPLLEKEVVEIHGEYKDKAKKFLKDFEGKITLYYEWLLLGCEWTRDYIKGPILHEDAFSKDEIYNDYDKPSEEELIKIETFCKLTGCIYKVAKELYEERYSTSNVYFHLLAELKVMLKQELASTDNDYFLRKATKMFDKYWNDMFLVLATASVLDPRFKMKYIEFYCSKKIDKDESSTKAETVLDYLRNLYARYAASDICQKPICPGPSIDTEEDEEEEKDMEEKKEKPDAYEGFILFQEFLKFEGCSRESQESELDSYLKEPVMEWNKDLSALEWWKEESQKYPIVSRVARDILSIPISRATSYDAYVSDKREPAERVLSLDPKVSNAMMCAKSWLRL